MSRLGNRIREARQSHGLTAHQLAYRAGVSVNTVTSIERGEAGSMATVDQIVEFLETTDRPVIFSDDCLKLGSFKTSHRGLILALVAVLREQK